MPVSGTLHENDIASRDYPSETVGDFGVHVYHDGEGWHVWLNTEVADFDGLCITHGNPTRELALVDARRRLDFIAEYLRDAS